MTKAQFDSTQLFDDGNVGIGCVYGTSAESRTHQHACQGVVVTLFDGIEFMIVTLSTRQGRSKECFAQSVDRIGNTFLGDTFRCGIVAMPTLSQSQHHRTDESIVDTGRRVDSGRKQIASNLFDNQLAKRNIGIEGSNQIVAIPPRVLGRHVPFISVRVRVMNDVHPMPCPVFSEMRTIEQLCYHVVVRLLGVVR